MTKTVIGTDQKDNLNKSVLVHTRVNASSEGGSLPTGSCVEKCKLAFKTTVFTGVIDDPGAQKFSTNKKAMWYISIHYEERQGPVFPSRKMNNLQHQMPISNPASLAFPFP
jgi:hypothetical protein